MTIYDLIYEEINDRYENGKLTLEQANEVNDLAYEKYINESVKTKTYKENIQEMERYIRYLENEISKEKNSKRKEEINQELKSVKLKLENTKKKKEQSDNKKIKAIIATYVTGVLALSIAMNKNSSPEYKEKRMKEISEKNKKLNDETNILLNKWKNGEITVDEFEKRVKEARDKIYPPKKTSQNENKKLHKNDDVDIMLKKHIENRNKSGKEITDKLIKHQK